MPDESREALQGLLQFLKEVSEQSDVNQVGSGMEWGLDCVEWNGDYVLCTVKM